MEWIIWVIVIVLIIAAVWWLLNRNSGSAAGASDANGTGQVNTTPLQGSSAPAAGVWPAAAGPAAAESAPAAAPTPQQAPVRPESPGPGQANPEDVEPDIESWDAATPRPAAGTHAPSGGDVDDWEDDEDKAEWDTQWSESSARTGTAPAAHPPAAEAAAATQAAPAHHPEYTEPHAPTLPGAESAAAEDVDAEAETRQRMESSAATESDASHVAEPAGHLEAAAAATVPVSEELAGVADAAGQPYGEGSAASAADGSGPEGYTVKADTGSMTYYDEDSSGYEEARADTWFLSPAHAEAAGFRAPRRTRR